MHIVLATRNQHKKQELIDLLRGLDITIRTLDDFPEAPEVVEDGDTCEANAMKKAVEIAQYTGLTAVADDTGLEVDALGGRPGVFAARYAGEQATYEDNCRKLLQELQGVPAGRRSGRFVTVAAIATPEGRRLSVKGVLEGMIAEQPTGSHGFGYDPVFVLPEYGRTLAQLSPEVKNQISHRARAFTQARTLLQQVMAEQHSVGA
ncbi:MAG: XTP/dITP diphosphatase [Nitrospira sp.]|uniref:dITP/XTP pyrophosphatase n=1 Tax=Nitrospira defluvii TaxID=330214 RepID=A0ABN7L191_9BACT|nr:XTP/dITP diphosphatase [Nitrospira defluvii]MCS6328442.1 XTP/dITP diphosphatase [Nitrospira sp.]CAE6725670.1 dITP/XTP pyrophosphatase [Nitrospira defluvii]